jgi:hypothetical protein
MKWTKPLIVVAAAVVLAAAWFGVDNVQDRNALTGDSADHQSAAGPAGYVIHIDPATGRIVDESPNAVPVAIDDQMSNRLSTSPEGLVETASPAPGGGTMVDLQGRFQNAFVATVDDSGLVGAACVSDAAKDAAEGGEER